MKKLLVCLAFVLFTVAAKAEPLYYFGYWLHGNDYGFMAIVEDDALNEISVAFTDGEGNIIREFNGNMSNNFKRSFIATDGLSVNMRWSKKPDFNWRGAAEIADNYFVSFRIWFIPALPGDSATVSADAPRKWR